MKKNKAFVITIFLLTLSIIAVGSIAQRGIPVVAQTNLENLPTDIMGFKSVDDFFDDAIYQELNADKHVYRHYRSTTGEQIDLYIGYYGTAKGGRTPHNPYACLPGAGWGIINDEKIKLKTDKKNEYENVNFITTRKGESYDIIYHWYQSAKNKVLSTGIEQNIQRFVGKVLYNRNDGAFVRVSASTTKENVEQTKIRVKKFSEEILQLLPDYWPVEQDKIRNYNGLKMINIKA